MYTDNWASTKAKITPFLLLCNGDFCLPFYFLLSLAISEVFWGYAQMLIHSQAWAEMQQGMWCTCGLFPSAAGLLAWVGGLT